MSIAEELRLTASLAEPASLSVFQQAIPADWIEQALQASGTASIRKRKLPAEQVVWLVLGMGLYRNRSIADVCDKLALVMPAADTGLRRVAPSALTQARERLGSEPLRYLFLTSAQAWAEQETAADWCGLKLLSVDGTVFHVPDSDDNARHFGYQDKARSAFPSLTLVSLLSVHSHLLWDVTFGPSSTGEISHARQLVGSAPARSLTLFDRCYFSAELLLAWQQQQPDCHWLLPMKHKLRHTVIERYGPHDCLVEMPISPQARRQHPHLPTTWQARLITYASPRGTIKGFVTSLTDPQRYPLAELLGVYWQRWEIEQGYGELKSRQLANETVLRSQTPGGIEQEMWGILLAYNLIRLEISRIATEANVPPQRISFIMALRYIQDEFLWCAIASPGTIPKKLRDLRDNVKRFIVPERKRPPKPRAVRSSKTQYPIHLKPQRRLN